MDYKKTWEVMNSLEQSFNRVTTIGDLIDDLDSALSREDLSDSRLILDALKAYYPAFLNQYDSASKRAWNNTVLEVGNEKTGDPRFEYPSVSYEEIERFFYDEDISYTRDPDRYYHGPCAIDCNIDTPHCEDL